MMEEKFQNSIDGFNLPADATVTVALSGGLDSVVLLDLFRKKRCKFTLKAIHVNHGIRGENAHRDAKFCQKLCTEWGVPLQVFEGDAPTYAKEHGMSLEEGARALRYGFLEQATKAENAFVATAHHRGDQQETFFLNLYRGSGSSGLSGIKRRRDRYLRPLLSFTKDELIAYAEQNGLRYVTDETNADTAYLRNFLRHEVLPLLESRAEGRFSEGLAAAMHCLQAEDEALNLWADGIATDAAEELGKLPSAVLKRVLDRMNGGALDRLHFGEIEGLIRKAPPAGQIQISENRYFRIEYGRCLFLSTEQAVRIPAVANQAVEWGGQRFMLRLEKINRPFTNFDIDCDKIEGNPVFRRKLDGDVFRPVGKGGTSRLQKRLKNDRVPRSRRDRLWVLADGQDQVIWVESYGVSKEFACDASTARIYTVEIGDNKEDKNA